MPIFSELTQTFVYELLSNLQARQGLDVEVLTWNRKNAEERPFHPVYEVSPPTSAELARLRAQRTLPPSWENGLPPTRFEKQVRQRLVASRTDIVHAQFGPTAVLIGRACREAGIPLVVTFRGRDASAKIRKWRWRRLYRRSLANAAAITCVSPDLCERIRPMLPAELEPVFIPGGKHPRLLEYRPPGPPSGRLVSIGRLIDKKGHSDAIRAVARARESGAEVTLTVIGEGPLRDRLQEEIAELGLEGSVTLTGPLPFERVVALMGEADFLVAANRTGAKGDREGIPNVVKEAQLLGVPVIGTRHGGIPYAIPGAFRTELVAEGDIDGLARRIREMNQLSEGELEERARIGRRFVLDRFDPVVEARDYQGLYEQVAGGSKAPAVSREVFGDHA
ncbi:glycosyltransferase [Thiohalorhabdus sp.]|uniref:glycosyltransferase n=1 Tax=Thiohalorhabdus sp. TaxID=3094134 RepID=UPI002FC2927E